MRETSWTGTSERSMTYSTQLGQSLTGVSGLFDDIRRLARFKVFETPLVKVEDLFRISLVNLLVDFEGHEKDCAASWLRNPNIVP